MREKIKNVIDKWNNLPLIKGDWIFIVMVSTFLFWVVFYADLIIIYDHSLTFLDSLFHGDIANFYSNTLQKQSYGFGAVYYWVPYAIEGIWVLPIYVINKIFGIDVHSVGCFVWIKLGILLTLIATIILLGRMLKELDIPSEKCKFAQFMFLSSFIVQLPVIGVAQIDIIAIFLMLVGIREYVRNERITWKFLVIFSFTATIKSFALFVFLPLVFLKEKRILNVVWDIFVGLLGIFMCLIPYAGRADYKESTAVLNDVMIERLFATKLQAGNVDIPIFFALLVGLCIWCYTRKISGKKTYFVYAVWVALTVFVTFFIFVFAHPYWIVLIAPFVIIIITLNDMDRKLNMALELFISASVMYVYFGKFGVFLKEVNYDLMILPKFGITANGTGYLESSTWMVAHGLDQFYGQMFAIFAVCAIAFLIINRPNKLEEKRIGKSKDLIFDHGLVLVREIMLLVYILAYIYIGYVN